MSESRVSIFSTTKTQLSAEFWKKTQILTYTVHDVPLAQFSGDTAFTNISTGAKKILPHRKMRTHFKNSTRCSFR